MGILQSFQGILDTARGSVQVVLDAQRGRLSPESCDDVLDHWCHKLLRNADVELFVHGREHVDPDRSCVVMSNHQSLYDIPVIYCAIPGRLRMVAKAELFQVPVWGRAMELAGFIKVDRKDHRQAVASLRAGSSMLQSGTKIWIAPEGTRSRSGALGPFKSGGFRMALETGIPILPVAIDGTRHVLQAKGFVVQNHHRVVVTILPPIDPLSYGMQKRKALMNDVRDAIAKALGHDSALVHAHGVTNVSRADSPTWQPAR